MLVKVRAAAVQPGEVMIRRARHGRWLARFPSRQGSDLAGVVAEAGPQVRGIAVGDEVLGFTHTRASHAEFVVVDDMNLTLRPEGLSPTIPASPAGSRLHTTWSRSCAAGRSPSSATRSTAHQTTERSAQVNLRGS
ncbi:alcohol dehydrogenase catalytic domain-containing protein [Micromonospora sp. NPDC049751]|uniref:alcohol dehydrogenase catalytic domain-containing protein n=1 Tax=unclassified Micromonospora TaxID=2617518 RepID=UPI0033C0E60E